MAYKEMYFVSDSYGGLTVHPEVLSITQNSNNTKIKLCGNFTDEALVWATIIQADGKTLPRRAVMLTTETIEIDSVSYRVYSYRLVQDDTKICPSATGIWKISFSVEDNGEEILTTNEYSLTIMRSNISAVTNTPADTIDAVTTKVNQNTADIAELESGMASIDLELDKKVDKNADILPATAAKITYDKKGLVIGGSSLLATDIPLLPASKIATTVSARFVTDAEKSTWNSKLDKKPDGTNDLITALNKIDARYLDIDSELFIVVASLPTTGVANKIYLVPKSDGAGSNIYDEYVWLSNKWEQFGTVTVDLSNYYNKNQTDTLLGNKQNKLTAGTNITIVDNVISSTGGWKMTIMEGF